MTPTRLSLSRTITNGSRAENREEWQGAHIAVSPRPKKERRCEGCPGCLVFKPAGTPLSALAQITLGRDELEVLKLCDRDDLNQQQAGARMGISRGTVQRLLSSARKKVATALSSGAALLVATEE